MKQFLIKWINKQLCALLPGAKIYGIAKPAKRGNEILPVTIQNEKEFYVGIDGKEPLQLYHKEISTTSTQETRNTYGDAVYDDVTTHQMSMIIFFDEKRMGIDADELYIKIQRTISGLLKIPGTKSVYISVTSIIMDDARVYQQEYQSDTFRLSVCQRLIQVNYNIRVAIDKRCLEECI